MPKIKKKRELEQKWHVGHNSDFNLFLNALLSMAQLPKPEYTVNDDYYVDTPKRCLRGLNLICRIRLTPLLTEFTAKTANKINNGMANRGEETYPLKHCANYNEALLNLKEVFPYKSVNAGALENIFRITTSRTLYKIEFGGGLKTEIALDSCVIYSGGKTRNLNEIECELLEGRKEDFYLITQTLTQKSGLKPAELSKVATAVKMLGGAV